jgi:hypothetical protein
MKFRIKSVTASHEEAYRRKGEPFKDSNKTYLWVSGETVIENLVNRHSRPYKFYQKEILPAILKRVAEENPNMDFSTDVKDWSWSQKCGCSMCPCSPGFYQKSKRFWRPINISAEIEFFEETVASSEEA